MSFPRYPKYKDSGAEWLGEVPQHWSAGRLRRFARRYSGGTPDKTNLGYWQDGVIPWLNSGAVNDRLISEPSTFITAEAFANSSAKWVPRGALVMALAGQGKTKGMVAQLAISSTCNQSMAAIVPNPNLDARFLFWWLDSNYQSIRNLAGGDLRDGLNLELVGNIPLPVLPLPEQTAIAEFLDRETGKIDELIAGQERLIELLKEKRQAVISHAVTKGLDPRAPMRSSGVEWLGDVPKHWAVLPLKRIVSVPITDGPHETPQFVEEGVPFVSAEAVSSGQIDFAKVRGCISPEDNARYSIKYSPKLHDIYMVKSGATTGVTAIVEDRTDFNIWSPLAVIRCNSGSVPYFVLNFMRSRHFLEAVTLFWSFGTQQNIGMGVIENLACAVPPVEEQRAVVAYLKSELAKFDALTAEAQRAIELLKERRTALISAAVTGQIDVRQRVLNLHA